MNIKTLILEALVDGAAERDENNNVSFELFGKAYSVRVTDEDLKAYEKQLEAELEQAELDYADAESLMASAKAKIEAAKNRKESKTTK